MSLGPFSRLDQRNFGKTLPTGRWNFSKGNPSCSIEGRIISQKSKSSERELSPDSTTPRQLVTLGKSRPTMLSRNSTGGQECAHLSRNTWKDVESVNNSKLIGLHLTRPLCQLKDQRIQDLLPIVLWTWTWSPTYHPWNNMMGNL